MSEKNKEDLELEKIRAKKRREIFKRLSLEAKKAGSEEEVSEISKQVVMPEGVLYLTEKNYGDVVQKFSIVIVDFYADWCGPCKVMEPVLETLARDYAGKVVFARFNVDTSSGLAYRMGVTSIPTFMVYLNGKPVQRIVGAVGRPGLEKVIMALLRKIEEEEKRRIEE